MVLVRGHVPHDAAGDEIVGRADSVGACARRRHQCGQIDDGEESYAPIAYLADSHNEPTNVLASRQFDKLQSEGLSTALESLDERCRRIVQARWLDVEDDGSGGKTLHELADEFGVSAERIRQIEASAMKKMRSALTEYA